MLFRSLYQTDNLNNPLWYTATDTLNELRQDRGAYRLSVVHESFSEGQLVNEEVRYNVVVRCMHVARRPLVTDEVRLPPTPAPLTLRTRRH